MGRPKKTDRQISRELIWETAAALFGEHGYEKTRIVAIAQRLDVTSAALYHHFASKGEILSSLLERGLERVIELTEHALTGTTPSERLRQLVRTYVMFGLGELEGSKAYAPVTFGFFQLVRALEPGERRRLAKVQRSYLDLLRRIITDGIASGEFAVRDVDAAAFAIVGMGAHTMHWFKPGRRLSASDLAEQYADHAVSIVRAR